MEEDGCKQNDKQTSLRKTEKNWVTNEKEEIGQNNKFDLFDSAGNNNDKLWIKLKIQTIVATFEYSKPCQKSKSDFKSNGDVKQPSTKSIQN